MILTSLGILMELVDISAPGTEKKRDFMREKAEKKEDQRNVFPPQVFNGDKYCGVSKVDIKIEHFLLCSMRIMKHLTLLMRMMDWRSFLDCQGKHQK